MARTVTTFFNMKENYSGGMRRAARATSEFQRKVTAAARVLDRENRKRREIRIQNRNANAAIASVSANLKKIKDLRINIAARTQNFKRDMKPVTNDIKNLVKKPLMVTLKLKDMALSGLRKAGDLLKTLAKGATIGLGLAGGALGASVRKGMTLQQYQAAIEHSVYAANRNLTDTQAQEQAKGYSDWLLDFQAKSSASMLDVFAGGAHALTATGGDIGASRGLIRMAQDMVAKTPDKDLYDAVEAIRDATTGQFRRLLDFGFVIGEKEMAAAGGDIFKAKDSLGRTMSDIYTGAEARYIESPAGMVDTLTGTLEGGIAQFGANFLTAIKPLLASMLPLGDNLAAGLAGLGTTLGEWVTDTIPKLKTFWDDLKAFFEPIVAWANEKWNMLKPFRDFVANAFAGVDVDGEKVLGGITGAIDQLVDTLIDWLNSLAQNWDKIEPVIAGIIRFLPQIALAFAGFKVISWGVKTGKAVGNFFGGVGSFFGNLFGRGKAAPVVPPAPPPAQDPVLKKTEAPRTGPNTNTFNGPNYNTFKGPNYNNGNGGGNGNSMPNMPSGGTPTFLPAVPPIPALGPGMPTMGLPSGGTPLGLPAGLPAAGAGASLAGAGTVIGAAITGLGALAAAAGITGWIKSGQAKKDFEKAAQDIPKMLSASPVAGLQAAETKGYTGMDLLFGRKPSFPPAKVQVEPDTGAMTGPMVSLLNGEAINGTVLLSFIPNPAGGNPLNQPILKKNAAGIKRVPWDNYPTLLHKGETVLPSGEAGEYRDQGNRRGGGVNISGVTVNISGANRNGEQLAAEFVRGLERAVYNMA